MSDLKNNMRVSEDNKSILEDNTNVLNIKNLKKSYGTVEVLHGLNVSIKKGEFLVLLGESGCGKSTLLNTIAGLENITSGAIEIGGKDVSHVPPKDRDIAMVFQSYALYPNMNVARNITFGMEVRKEDKKIQQEALQRVAKQLQIDHLLDRKPAALSGGQRQRVAIGRALVRKPTLFLFDEPLSNLDAKLRMEMRKKIKKLHKDLDASIVYVTHDQIEAMSLATKVALMNDGYIQQLGTPQELYDVPANLFVARFIGSPSMNLLAGTLSVEGKKVMFSNHSDSFDVSHYPFVDSPVDGMAVVLGVRPEHTTETKTKTSVKLSLPVESFETNGFDRFATLTYGDDEIVARFKPTQALTVGETVECYLDLTQVSLFSSDSTLRL